MCNSHISLHILCSFPKLLPLSTLETAERYACKKRLSGKKFSFLQYTSTTKDYLYKITVLEKIGISFHGFIEHGFNATAAVWLDGYH